jgi:hypothetical protein
MKTGNKYYTPTIDEFEQGFEFEYYDTTSYRMVLLDFSGNSKSKDLTKPKEIGWVKRVVDWKHDPKERIIEHFKDDGNNDCMLELSGDTANWFSPMYGANIQKLIDDGKVRAKRK